MRRALVLLVLTTPGCGFYFGGDDCQYGGGGGSDGIAAVSLRNPESGQCEFWGGGGPCDDSCGPCPLAGDQKAIAQPTWGYCDSYCSGLDETTCQATSGCRAAYLDACYGDPGCDLSTQRVYLACWSTDQTGPIQGDCLNLDAYSCSLHDDCVAVHYDACAAPSGDALIDPAGCLGNFEACLPEGPTDPPVPACEELVDETSCLARADCEPIYEGINCTCDANGCTCQDWVYSYCSSTPASPQPGT